MNPEPPPPGGWPPQQPDSPTQPNYPVPPPQPGYPPPPPSGYPPQPQPGYPQPGPTGYEAPPPPGWQGPPTAPPGGTSPYQPPPPPPDNNTSRNLIIGVVVALLLVLVVGAVFVFANRPPAPSFPVIIPTVAPPSAEPTKTPKSTPSEEPVQSIEAPTEQPTDAQPTEEPATAEPTVPSGPTDEPPTQAPQTDAPTSPVLPTAIPSQIPGVEDHGLILASPVVIGDPATFQEVALLVQNIDVTVKSYSLKATFKDGNTITATATGFVNDHLQGSIRTPTLFVDGTPGASDTITVQVDTMFSEEPSTEGGDIAKQITFGPPTINTGDFATIDVEVTNGSDSNVNISVAAGVVRDGVLVGVASGLVSDMAPGQTKTASLFVTGSIEETDLLILTVETALANP